MPRNQFLRIIIWWNIVIRLIHKWACLWVRSAWFGWTGSWWTGSRWTGSRATGTGRGSWAGRTWSLGTFVAPFSSESHSTYLLFQLFDSFILFVNNISYFTQSCCCSWSWNYQMFFLCYLNVLRFGGIFSLNLDYFLKMFSMFWLVSKINYLMKSC